MEYNNVKNKKLSTARIIGWIILIGGAVVICIGLASSSQTFSAIFSKLSQGQQSDFRIEKQEVTSALVLTRVGVLGVAFGTLILGIINIMEATWNKNQIPDRKIDEIK